MINLAPAKSLFKDFIKVRITKTTDEFGDIIEEEQETQIQGILRVMSGNERFTADKETLFATHRLYTDHLNWKQTDKVRDEQGKDYKVKLINNVMGFDDLVQVDCEMVE